MGMNGIFQSSGIFPITIIKGWPGCVACMGNWFDKKSRGLLMGVWTGNTNFGDIIGYMISNLCLKTFKIGWQYTVFFCAGWLFIMSLAFMLVLQPYPEKVIVSYLNPGGLEY